MVKLTPAVVYSRTKMSVECVRKLNLWGCEIDDISLCAQMKNLQVLSLSVNRVKYLQPLEHCKKLEELYLRKNEIEDLSELEHLIGLKCLRVLWIDDNPCTQNIDYRRLVLAILPNISKLDNKMVTTEERRRNSTTETPLMTQSMYVGAAPPVIDTIMPFTSPLPISYSVSSNSWEPHPTVENLQSDDEQPNIMEMSPRHSHLMNTSVMGSLVEDENEDSQGWSELDPPTPVDPMSSSRMFQSVYEPSQSIHSSRSSLIFPQKALSGVRNRASLRSQSMSPARQQRVDNVISAICVLMDELDQTGLKIVIEQAQHRIKKQH